jgi:RimJ/RimL family protein N-acetyltransferase
MIAMIKQGDLTAVQNLKIRLAKAADFEKLWPILQSVIREGTTYEYPADMTKKAAFHSWLEKPEYTYLAERKGEVIATYYIKTNHSGQGNHVCNCGYIVAPNFRGQGIGSFLCQDSQKRALEHGYRAMQFNFVASTNLSAVRLWLKLGYKIVGCLPEAFNHPEAGFVDAYVMYKFLK